MQVVAKNIATLYGENKLEGTWMIGHIERANLQ
jgi:hypothetical protein